jgi:outer membrane protein OmpA-like peptidoglycan-associated protein
MHSSDRQFKTLGVFVLAGMLFLSGCATRKWVRNEIAPIGPRITAVENSGKENAERIDAVDRRAQQGITAATTAAATADTKATQAGQAAATAQTAATAAQRQADTANQGVQTANNRINTLETRITSLDAYAPSGQPQSVTFKSGSVALSTDAKKALDDVASQVANLRSGYMFEVQGFADSQGSESFNEGLSQRRAEAVLRYLVSKNVPLFRISIVGLGESNPVAPNNTRKGREQNRRVEVRMLRAGGGTTTN